MGSGGRTKIGYHYRPAYHVGLCRGRIDAFLEFRCAGDKIAWAGRMEASGRIQIDAPELFGGEKDQGGIVGPVDVMFGDADQLPNEYLREVFGDQVVAWRGLATLAFCGGRYGAMNPMPQRPAYRLEKILHGWDGDWGDDPCWYPERARVFLSPGEPRYFVAKLVGNNGKVLAGASPYDFNQEIDTGLASIAMLKTVGPALYVFGAAGTARVSLDRGKTLHTVVGLPSDPSTQDIGFADGVWIASVHSGTQAYRSTDGITFSPVTIADSSAGWGRVAGRGKVWFICRTSHSYVRSTDGGVTWALHWVTTSDGWAIFNGPGIPGTEFVYPISGGWIALSTGDYSAFSVTGATDTWIAVENPINGGSGASAVVEFQGRIVLFRAARTAAAPSLPGPIEELDSLGGTLAYSGSVAAGSDVLLAGTAAGADILIGDEWEPLPLTPAIGGYHVGVVPWGSADAYGMNPAHSLFYVRTDGEKGRVPIGDINDASLRAAADRLYYEGFGINWEYDPQRHTPDSWCEHIERLIAGSFERSLEDGQWYLDLARDDYVLDELPIIDDGDILEFRELPTTLSQAVNSVSVKYFDVVRKEFVITPAARALGLIRRFGEIHQTLDFPEIGNATLAVRVAVRELRSYTTPTRAFELVTTPRPRDIRRSQKFRLQSPKRRIVDMVCIVGEKQHGTLRSGAIRWTVTQHVASMPSSAWIEIEEGVDTRPSQTPLPITAQRAYEAPYVDVCAAMPRAELQALPEDVGFLVAAASDPGQHLDYAMAVSVDGGDYGTVGTGDWAPTAVVVGDYPAALDPTDVHVAGGKLLGTVAVGELVLWDDEWCRLDAIDLDAEPPVLTLARGCADTVPADHLDGSRLWFPHGRAAFDATEYSAGEEVDVKLLSNTGSRRLPAGSAAAVTVALDQRQARPYPPGGLRINGEAYPASINGDAVVTWAHRDRVLQADMAVDAAAASIGPEPGVQYAVRNVDLVTDTETYLETGIAGDTHTIPAAALAARNRLEVWSVRGELDSLQRAAVEFAVGFEIDGAAPPIAANNETYSAEFTASDGSAPYTWSVSSGALPDGLALDGSTSDTVAIEGVPEDSAGYYTFTLRCEDSNGAFAAREMTIALGDIVSLAHFDGPNGGTSFVDQNAGRTWTRTGTSLIISTAQHVFGGASLYGGAASGNYLVSDDTADFAFGTGDFTIDFWYRTPPSLSGFHFLADWRSATNQAKPCIFVNGANLVYYVAGAIRITSSAALSVNTWYHVRLARVAGVTRMFINGSQSGSPWADATNYVSARCAINSAGDSLGTFGALMHIDEFKVIKGAGQAASFDVPAQPSDFPAIP